jgi:YebC/PmpR family DNA-binding regulatory protein
MAGHSKFANIKHRKGAQDKKRANLFTKLAREIVVAAKMGQADPDFNPRLRLAISNAKSNSMPKDRIETAIKKATSPADGENYDEVRYEGYAPGGIALIIDTLTDNRNRSVAEVRSTLTKNGGTLGESGSVSFNFERIGLFKYKKETASDEEMLEAAIEAGADNCESYDEFHEITCDADAFNEVQQALADKFGDPDTGRLDWRANTPIDVDVDTAEKIENLIEKLEDLDDVQMVSSNHSFNDEVAEELEKRMNG